MYFVNRYSLTPMITLLVTTRHGVIYDFYFFGHRWSHYFILLSSTTLCKITGYDLQLHLKYRNNIWNKKTKIQYCLCTKFFLRLPHPRRPRGGSVGSGEKAGRKFSSTGKRAPGYRLSPNYFQKFKRMPAPDWAQKMLCIVPNRRRVSPEFFSWVRTRWLLSGSFTKLLRARETFIFYFPNQKRRNYRWVENTFGMLSAGAIQFAPRIFCIWRITSLRCGGDERVK